MRSAIPWQEQWDAGLARVLSSFSFCFLLLITTVNEHWALLPASARDAYPVSSRGTGITVLTYQLESLSSF
jgi:hypothetical protein